MRVLEGEFQRSLQRLAEHGSLIVLDAAHGQQVVNGRCIAHRRLPHLAKFRRLTQHNVTDGNRFADEQQQENLFVDVARSEQTRTRVIFRLPLAVGRFSIVNDVVSLRVMIVKLLIKH